MQHCSIKLKVSLSCNEIQLSPPFLVLGIQKDYIDIERLHSIDTNVIYLCKWWMRCFLFLCDVGGTWTKKLFTQFHAPCYNNALHSLAGLCWTNRNFNNFKRFSSKNCIYIFQSHFAWLTCEVLIIRICGWDYCKPIHNLILHQRTWTILSISCS